LFRNNFARVEKRLCLRKGFKPKWAWKRVFFKSFSLPKSINKHILISGESGSGKSNAAKMILKHLSEKGANFILFDPHDEYIDITSVTNANIYDASVIGIDMFALDGMSIKEKSIELTELFRKVFRLGEVQSNTLYRLISYTYNLFAERGKVPSISSILYSISVFKKHASKGELAILNSLEKRFMLASELGSKSIDIGKLLHERSIFALSSLHTSEAQAIYIEGFLRKLYSYILSNKHVGELYIVIDEIEKLGQSSILARLANEGRKYGIGIIAIAQHAKSVEKSIRGNASTVLAFYQREPEELNYVANMIAGGNELDRFIEVKKELRKLRQGHAIALTTSNVELVKFGLFKGREDASYYLFKLAKEPISEEKLIERLSMFGREEIMKSIEMLIRKGLLGSYTLYAKRYKGRYYMLKQRNSVEHDIMVHLISMHLKKFGIGNKIYNTSYGPDIIARIGRKRVAIEYETGRKSDEETLAMLEKRKAHFDKVIVVANHIADFSKIKAEGIEVFDANEFFEKDPRVIFNFLNAQLPPFHNSIG